MKTLKFILCLFEKLAQLAWLILSFPFKLYVGIMEIINLISEYKKSRV